MAITPVKDERPNVTEPAGFRSEAGRGAEAPMNYRHAFHAGNFADLVKHATVTVLIEALLRNPASLRVLDTHAGAGAYDLTGALSARTGEAEAGIVRLMADPASPPAFETLKAAVRRLNPQGGVRFYPGSPLLISQSLRPQDRYVGCELREDDRTSLAETLKPFPTAKALLANGYEVACEPPPYGVRQLVVIDPPFERPDDYDQIIATADAVLAADPSASLAAWLPLKDLETFDAFLRHLEDIQPGRIVVAEARLKPLHDPMRMNGCAMVLIQPPAGIEPQLETICDWVATRLGGDGARGRVTALSG
jgi:23S rRNA (adenine2030-N6)-methyltransferase